MTLKKLICTGALILAGASASAQSATLPEARAEADALLSAVREQDRAPGMMAAVIQAGELIWSGAVGYADLETGVALSETTRMRIGSVSKPVTAVLALRLAEQGRLDLDGDLTDAIPELVEPEGGAITPRHLAYHTAGIRQYDFSNYLDANNVF